MIKNLCIGLALSSGLATAAFAESNDAITMHIEHVNVQLDAFTGIDRISTNAFASSENDDSQVFIDQIFNIGQKIWDVIKANEPVANIKYNYANGLPRGVTSSESLDNFSDLQSEGVRVYGTNGFGATVYDVTLVAVHQYGGSYEGKGQYLETVSIIPTSVDVTWGYKVDVNVTNITSVNLGSKQAPVAGITMESTFKVSTVLQKHEQRVLYSFRGDSAKVKTTGL